MQTWFITGASGGLASRMTRRLLDRGDRVAATVRKPGILDDIQAQYGSQLWQANLDLTNPQQIAEVVERAFSELGTIDVFVNNAAYGLYGAVEEASDRQIEHQFMTNVLGSLRAARAVLPFFRKQGGGHIRKLVFTIQAITPSGTLILSSLDNPYSPRSRYQSTMLHGLLHSKGSLL